MLRLGMENWNLVVAVLIPLAVGLVTKVSASSAVKAVTLIVANAVNALAEQAMNDNGLVTESTFRGFVTSLVVSIALYYGVWKPTTVAPKVAAVTGDAPPIG